MYVYIYVYKYTYMYIYIMCIYIYIYIYNMNVCDRSLTFYNLVYKHFSLANNSRKLAILFQHLSIIISTQK